MEHSFFTGIMVQRRPEDKSMKTLAKIVLVFVILAGLGAVAVYFYSQESATIAIEQGYGPNPTLPHPIPNPSQRYTLRKQANGRRVLRQSRRQA
jgi:hypothetical protein